MPTRTAIPLRSSVLPLTVALALVFLGAAHGQEKLPPGTTLTRIEVQPVGITLKTPFEYSQLVVTGVLPSGERLDVTRLAQVERPASLVTVSPTGVVRPVADGDGVLKIGLAGQTASVAVKVAGLKEKNPVSFVRDVMPVLSRIGCNAGTCHGSAEGKNGFKLSLRGYDPILDHRSLTDDLEGRRFNRVAPDASLMLLKTSGSVPHAGGVVTGAGQPYYELLRAWIADGVKFDPSSPRVSKLDVSPRSVVLPLPEMKQQMTVQATFTDGSVRDVTLEAFIESSNTEVATVDRNGIVTAVRRGEATMLARYEGSYAAAGLFVMGDRRGFTWQPVEEYNYADTLVYEKLRQVKVLPSGVCTDAEFIRRVYLDLTGLPPEPEQVKAFQADPRPTRVKRDELVDKLVGSPEYIEHWTNKWADLLQVNSKFLGGPGATAFRAWIRKAVADNMPYDKFANAILTASGSNLDNPAASYFKVLRDPDAVMENTTQLFLAVRFNCNKCHDHPFERWTQDQYYNLASFFAQVGRAEDPRYKGQRIGGTDVEGAKPLVEIISDLKGGEVTHQRTGALAKPIFPYTHADLAPTTAPRRTQLAHWVTSKDNPYFAKSYVNRLWSYLLGVGLIEPIDDIRAGNPPTNPKLLDRLTEEFVRGGFNVQQMLKVICKSRVYQQSVMANEWNKDDEINYARALPRRLPAEVLYDTIHRALDANSRLPGGRNGRAAQLLDTSADVAGQFLNLFGKPPRESACECERSGSMMLGPVLNLVNGPVVAEAIRDPQNRLARLLTAEKNDTKLVEEIYLALLCRPPSKTELELGLQSLKDGEPAYPLQVEAYNQKLAALKAYEGQMGARQAQWEAGLKNAPVWSTVEVVKAVAKAGAVLTPRPDGSILASGKNAANETYTVTALTRLKGITAIRLEALPDPSLPAMGPGRAPNGNFVLNYLKLDAKEAGAQGGPAQVKLHKGVATHAQAQFPAANALLNQPQTGWAIADQFGKAHSAYFELQTPLSTAKDTELTFTLVQKFPGKDHNLGKFRLSVTTSKPPLALTPLPENLAKLLSVEPAQRTPQQKAELANLYRAQDQEYARLQRVVAEPGQPIDKRQPGAQDLAWALINTKAFLFNR